MQPARKIFLLSALMVVSGCASHSAKTVATLDVGKSAYQTEICRTAMKDAQRQDDMRLVRMFASPALVVVSGGLLAGPVLAANVGFDTADHVTASNISVACGGQPKTTKEIAVDVARGAAFGLTTGGLNSGVSASTK